MINQLLQISVSSTCHLILYPIYPISICSSKILYTYLRHAIFSDSCGTVFFCSYLKTKYIEVIVNVYFIIILYTNFILC